MADGLDTVAAITLNGHEVARATNIFVGYRFAEFLICTAVFDPAPSFDPGTVTFALEDAPLHRARPG